VTRQCRATQRHERAADTLADPDAALRASLRQYVRNHPRRGFRPAYHDAPSEGWIVNHKKIQRLWREEGLRVPQRRRRKRHGTSTAPLTVTADAPNRGWAVDFQFDVTTESRPIKIASIVDEHTRECLGGLIEGSITGEHLIEELDRLAAERGTYPEIPRSTTVSSLHSSPPHDTRHRQGLGVLKATVNDSREARQDERRACRARSVSTI
jgi:transposase InsO family protein